MKYKLQLTTALAALVLTVPSVSLAALDVGISEDGVVVSTAGTTDEGSPANTNINVSGNQVQVSPATCANTASSNSSCEASTSQDNSSTNGITTGATSIGTSDGSVNTNLNVGGNQIQLSPAICANTLSDDSTCVATTSQTNSSTNTIVTGTRPVGGVGGPIDTPALSSGVGGELTAASTSSLPVTGAKNLLLLLGAVLASVMTGVGSARFVNKNEVL